MADTFMCARRILVKFVLAIALGLPLATPSLAQNINLDVPQVILVSGSTVAKHSVAFDWHAKRQLQVTPVSISGKSLVKRILGRGSYVCSPAGFGQKSRCQQR